MTTVSIATVLLSAPGWDYQLWDLLCPCQKPRPKPPNYLQFRRPRSKPSCLLPRPPLLCSSPHLPLSQSLGKKPGPPVNGVQLTHHHQRHGLQVLTVLPGESLRVSMELTALLSSCLGLASSGLNQFLCGSSQMTHGCDLAPGLFGQPHRSPSLRLPGYH